MAEDNTYPFPEDEFDQSGRDRQPQAVHRAPRPWWRVWGPLIAVVVLAPLLAILLVRAATSGGDSSAENPPAGVVTTDPDATDAPTDAATDPDATDGAAETVAPTPEATPEAPAVDKGVAVSVLNGARVQGLAGTVQNTLQGAGWTNVSAGNYQSAEPAVSTVYYKDATLQAAAQAVATELGIGAVAEYSGVESITVVLRADFTG